MTESETEDLRLSIIKKCETLIAQTHKRAEETLQFELEKSGEINHFNPPISIEGSWMLRLTTLQVYNSILIKKHDKKKFQLYTDNFDEISFE